MSPREEELLPHLGANRSCHTGRRFLQGAGGVNDRQGRKGISRVTAASGGSESRSKPKLALLFSRSSVGLLQTVWLVLLLLGMD